MIEIVFHNPPAAIRHLRGKVLHWDGAEWHIPDAAFEPNDDPGWKECSRLILGSLTIAAKLNAPRILHSLFRGNEQVDGALSRWSGEIVGGLSFDPDVLY